MSRARISARRFFQPGPYRSMSESRFFCEEFAHSLEQNKRCDRFRALYFLRVVFPHPEHGTVVGALDDRCVGRPNLRRLYRTEPSSIFKMLPTFASDIVPISASISGVHAIASLRAIPEIYQGLNRFGD